MRKFFALGLLNFDAFANYKKAAIALLAVLFCLIIKSETITAQTVQMFTSGTWTVPDGVNTVKVQVWGGGGAGGGSQNTSMTNTFGGGGGGGGYSLGNLTVVPGQIYTGTIGGGGIGVTDAAGDSGGSSTFSGPGGSVTANGGGGGARGISSFTVGGIAGTGNTFSGGTGGTATANGAGGGGGAGNAGVGGNGSNAAGGAGSGGLGSPNAAPYIGGIGGAPRTSSGNGSNGAAPGGGGSGGKSNSGTSKGGDGAEGQIIITYSYNITPCIQWQKTFGGTSDDSANSIRQTKDGGYIIAGSTSSNDGDVTENHGGCDYWILKLDVNGNKIWQKTFGGSQHDQANSVQQTTDGGYIVAGSTNSNDGDVTDNHGGSDYWILKLDAYGNLLWQKTFGESTNEIAYDIQQTVDGGYIVAGNPWIIKLDANGNISWQKPSSARSIQQTSDGGYIAASDGDGYSGTGGRVIKLDANGNTIWQKVFDGSFNCIRQTVDSGYIVAGETKGDVPNYHPGDCGCWSDYYIVKLDANGNTIWQKAFGGSFNDVAYSIQQTTDGGYIVAGYTMSWDGDGDVTVGAANLGSWIIKLNANGNLLWEKTIQASRSFVTYACSIQQTVDGGYIVAGSTQLAGEEWDYKPEWDYSIVKLTDNCTSVTPAVSIAVTPDTSVCTGTKVTFTASTSNGGTTSAYQWKKNGINIGTNAKTYIDSTLKHGDSIYCMLTSNAAGATDSTAKSNVITMTVNNPVTPTITIAASPGASVFTGNKVTFTATVTNGGASPIYQWKKNGTNIGTNSNIYLDSALKTGDSIYCILTVNAPCTTIGIVNSNGIKITVNSSVNPPCIQWQKSFGGAQEDQARSIQQTTDGGYIVTGYTQSSDGDVTANHGGYGDFWVIKLNANGNKVWQKTLGGTGSDYAYSIQQTTDGGYIVAGITQSNDGDVTGNHGGYGDCWIVKLDTNGNIVWQKTLGGTNSDYALSIQQTTDGGYILAGYTGSNDGDVTGYHGGQDWDCWIVKLDSNGNRLWQKALGGTASDYAYSIQQTTDGGYIVAGTTQSNDGDVTGNHGGYDYWIVKLDANGNKLWQRTFGGTQNDYVADIKQTTDGGYIVAGSTYSNDGDVTGNDGSDDFWIVKLDTNGNMIWQKTFGGTSWDEAYSIQQTTDGGYIVAGMTESNNGDVSGNSGAYDYWIVKLDPNGNKLWQKALGGTGYDFAYSIQQTTDGGYIVAGYTGSNDGDVTGNHPGGDYWIVKLTYACTPVTPAISIAASPGASVCAGSKVTLTATETNGGTTPVYEWYKNGMNVGTNSNTYIVDTALKNNDSIYCMLTSNAAGATDSTAKSNVITMTVNSLLTPTVSIATSSKTTVCAGSKVTFTATATNGGTSLVYQWYKNGINVGTNSNTYIVDTALKNNDSIYCVLTSNVTCATDSTAKSNVITMTVNSLVTPTVSIATSPGTTVCAGSKVTFTATATNGGTSLVYQWYKNGINVGTNSNTYIVDTALKNNDSIYCVLTSNVTCATDSTAKSNVITMTVNSLVTPTVSIATSPGTTVCAGSKVTFTATATNGGTSPIYQWKKNGMNVGTNSNTYAVDTALKNGDSIYCILTSYAACATDSTAKSNVIIMTVNSLVTPTVSIATSPGTTVCAGSKVTFTATATNGGTSPIYQWKKNGMNVGTNSNTYAIDTALKNGDSIYCILTSYVTCATDSTAKSNVITMTVNSLVTPTVSIATSPGTTVCAGSKVTFTATATNGGTSPIYQWKKNGMNVGTNSNTYAVDTALKNGDSIYCILTSYAACATDSTAKSNVIIMTVNSLVTPTVSIATSPETTVCADSKVTFTATATNGGTSPIYQWKKNGINIGTNSRTYVADTVLKNGDSIYCILTSNAICTSSQGISNYIVMTVSNPVTPTISIAVNAGTTVCADSKVTFIATITNGGATSVYQWKKNGISIGTNTKTYIDSTLKNGDSIYCVLTSNAACATGSTAKSNVIIMTVNTQVTPTISIAVNPGTSVFAGSTVTFTATITNGGAAPVYQWKKNGINIGTNNKIYIDSIFKNGDSIYCVLLSSVICATTTTKSNRIKMIVNIPLTLKELLLAASPNPFNNTVRLTIISPVSVKAGVLITAITGQQVFTQDIVLKQGTNIITVPSTSWGAGIYYVQVGTTSETKSLKIMKE